MIQQRIDKENCYTDIRDMCSAQLNSLLSVDAAFIACEEDDPLELLNIIKRLVTARPDGNEELDRQKALSEWFGLKMEHGEVILNYGRRAIKTFESLTTTGIPVEEQPKPKQQSVHFIDGLDGSVPASLQDVPDQCQTANGSRHIPCDPRRRNPASNEI